VWLIEEDLKRQGAKVAKFKKELFVGFSPWRSWYLSVSKLAQG
jgi:hypothetical protein